MDMNLIRIGVTLLSMVVFAGILVWMFTGDRSARFAQAARVPLDEDLPGREEA